MAIFVLKADGSRQLFDRRKVIKTCLRMGAEREAAEIIAEKIEMKAYDGIQTKKILQMIFRLLPKYKPAVKHQIDLREALALMRSKPDFERFIQILLREHGYEVIPNQIIRGRCVEHEVDAVASKDGETCFVEVKHHSNFHTPTSLDVSRIARAVFEDVTEGFELGLNNLKIDRPLIICNTKLSNHAERYAKCRGILHVGWSSPPESGLQAMIEEKKLYPMTYLKGLEARTREKIVSAEIILLRDFIERDPKEVAIKTGIPKETISSIVKKARMILA